MFIPMLGGRFEEYELERNITGAYTLTWPAGAQRVVLLEVSLIGGGGSGGTGGITNTYSDPCGGCSMTRGGSAGGGGVGYTYSNFSLSLALNLTKTYSLNIGAGGSNSAGGVTQFKEDSTVLYSANGGGKGGNGGNSNPILGSVGGAAGAAGVGSTNGGAGVAGGNKAYPCANSCKTWKNGGAGGVMPTATRDALKLSTIAGGGGAGGKSTTGYCTAQAGTSGAGGIAIIVYRVYF